MNQELQNRIEKLQDKILDAREKITRLAETPSIERTVSEIEICYEALDGVIDEYRAILAAADADDRDPIERRQGRRVTELRQFAAYLPVRTAGDAVPLATSNQWLPATTSTAPPSRQVNNSSRPRDPARLRPAPQGPTVGGEIDCWCGSCKETRLHKIFAMVNGSPKQVICDTCGARHGFRLTPARKAKAKADPTKPASSGGGTKLSPQQLEQNRINEARTALLKELDDAKDARPFTKHGRFRAGEIIEHEEHGRGKIEHVIRGSLLVRFRAGLKPLDQF